MSEDGLNNRHISGTATMLDSQRIAAQAVAAQRLRVTDLKTDALHLFGSAFRARCARS